MRRSLVWLFILAAALCVSSLIACSCEEDDDDDDTGDDDDDDDDDDDNVDDLIDQGKYWLEVGEGDKARLVFLEALSIVPDHPEAMYGLALSDALHEMDVISIIYDYLMSFIDGPSPVKGDGDTQGMLDQVLSDILNGLAIERADELVSAAQSAQKLGGTFNVSMPIIMGFQDFGRAGTDWDASDLLAMESFGDLIRGLFKHLFVIDLNTNLAYIFMFMDLDTSGDTLEVVGEVVDMLIMMLTDPMYPDFLTLDEEGIALYKEAGLEFGLGCDRFIRTFESIAQETDDQTDDVLGYADLNANGMWDQGEPWVVPHFGALDQDGMMWWAIIHGIIEGLRNTYLDYTQYDIDPANPNPFRMALLNPVLEALGFPPIFNENMTLDIGSWYLNPTSTGLKDGLLDILNLLDAFLP